MAKDSFPRQSSGYGFSGPDIDFAELARLNQALLLIDNKSRHLLSKAPNGVVLSRAERKKLYETYVELMRLNKEGLDQIQDIKKALICFKGLERIVHDELYRNVAHNPKMPVFKYCQNLWHVLEQSDVAISELAVFRGCRSAWMNNEFRPAVT